MQRFSQKKPSLIWLSPLIALVVAGCGGLLTGRGLNLTGGSVPVGTSKAAVIPDPGDQLASQDPETDVTLTSASGRTASRLVPGDPNQTEPPNPDPQPPGGGGAGGGTGPGPILPTTPGGTPTGVYREYTFDNLPAGAYDLNVSLADAPGIGPYTWRFDLPAAATARFVASLWPTTFEPDTVGEVQISPRFVTVSPGETVRFFGAATDVMGNAIPHSASFMLLGDTGELAPKGMFTARRLGKSTLTAWMNGKTATAEITVVP